MIASIFLLERAQPDHPGRARHGGRGPRRADGGGGDQPDGHPRRPDLRRLRARLRTRPLRRNGRRRASPTSDAPIRAHLLRWRRLGRALNVQRATPRAASPSTVSRRQCAKPWTAADTGRSDSLSRRCHRKTRPTAEKSQLEDRHLCGPGRRADQEGHCEAARCRARGVLSTLSAPPPGVAPAKRRRAARRVHMRGGARRLHARRSLSTLSVQSTGANEADGPLSAAGGRYGGCGGRAVSAT